MVDSFAAQLVPNQGLVVTRQPIASPGPGEVQVQVQACGLTAWEWRGLCRGVSGPMSLGEEAIGRVTAVGDGVDGLKVGDRVAGPDLSLQSLMNVPAGRLHRLDDLLLLPVEHCLVAPVASVAGALNLMPVRPGDRVVLIGCGPMGGLFVQLLMHSSIERLVVLETDPSRRELASGLGATAVLDPSSAEWPNHRRELSKMSIDLVVECAGTQPGLQLAGDIVRPGGRVLSFGRHDGLRSLEGAIWSGKCVGLQFAGAAGWPVDPWPAAIRLVAAGIVQLEPVISHVVGLDGLVGLVDSVRSGAQEVLKVVVSFP